MNALPVENHASNISKLATTEAFPRFTLFNRIFSRNCIFRIKSFSGKMFYFFDKRLPLKNLMYLKNIGKTERCLISRMNMEHETLSLCLNICRNVKSLKRHVICMLFHHYIMKVTRTKFHWRHIY